MFELTTIIPIRMNSDQDLRPFPVSKDILDTSNSLCWFAADAAWMLGAVSVGLIFMVPTIVSGILLLYIEKRKPIIFINVAINCWILMNSFWMLSEGQPEGPYSMYSKVFFVLGAVAVFVASLLSKNLAHTFSHFRRFRVLKHKL